MATKLMNGSHGAAELSEPPKRKRTRHRPVVSDPSPGKPWYDLTPQKIITWALSLFVMLIGAGWMTLPAKQSEVTALATAVSEGFSRMDAGFKALGGRLQAVEEKMDTLRTDVVRVQTIQDFSTVTPPPARPIRKTQKPKEPVKPAVQGWFN